MPSWQANAVNRLSRLLVKRRWEKFSSVDEMRAFATKLDDWLSSSDKNIHVDMLECAGIPCQWTSAAQTLIQRE